MNRQLAKQYFERAETLLNAGKPADALPLLDQLNDAFPNTKNILFARAKTYAALNRTSDALHACDALIEQHQSKRAAALKQQLVENAQRTLPPEPRKTVHRFSWLRLAALIVLVVAAAGAYAAYNWPQIEDVDPELPQTVERAERVTPRPDPERAAQIATPAPKPERIARIPAPTPKPAAPQPGLIHPKPTWELGESGVPVWKSGVFRRVPCINDPERTIDVYLPLAYDAKPDMLFPAVIIQMARGNPGFIDLENWAERTEVILVALNNSRNSRFAENHITQDHALETIIIGMRLDERMGFAIGMSGGAQSSWFLVYRYPENFSGLVMMGQGGIPEYMIAPHVRVAYIHGVNERNNWHIERMQNSLRTNGNVVRDVVVPGEHVTGPPSVRIEMLNWMVHAARDELGLPQPGR